MDWLEEELGAYEDDYLIIDCPGKPLELTTPSAQYVPQFERLTRSNRAIHTPSLLAHPRSSIATNGYSDMCSLSDRVAIHGR